MSTTKTRTPASTGNAWMKTAQRKGLKLSLVMTDPNGGTQSIQVPWSQVSRLGVNVKPFARHVTTAYPAQPAKRAA